MPRTVKQRVSWVADLGFLTRLGVALEMDKTISIPLKKEIARTLNDLCLLFHKAEAERHKAA